MPFTTRVMAQGDWSVKLRSDTPNAILRQVGTPYSLIVVTPARLQSSGLSDSAMLGAARYVGVMLRPGPQLELGGAGLPWLLGDDQGRQPLEAAVTQTAASLTTWITALLPAGLTVGTISGAGTLTGSFRWVSSREAIDAVCQAFAVEWRVNNTLTVDTGTSTTLYGATPTAFLVARDGPRDVGTITGVTGVVSSQWDWEGYASKVVLVGNAGRGSSGGASAYYGPGGALLTLTRLVEAQEAQPGSESTLAAQVLAGMSSTVRRVSVTTSSYDVAGKVALGANIYIYDPLQGLQNSANQVAYRGAFLSPATARVLAVTSPIERGMGVYVRNRDASAASYVDLSDYVEWDGPGGSLELGAPSLTIQTSSPTNVAESWTSWDPYTPTVAGMTLGNGTAAGAYRRIGTTMAFRVVITAGSTSANGAGAWTVSLPSGVTAASGQTQTVAGVLGDSSAGQLWRLTGLIRTAATTVDFIYGDASGLSLAGAQPITIGTGDTIQCSGTIEVVG